MEEEIQKVAVAPDVGDLTGEKDDRSEQDNGEKRGIMQEAPVGARLFFGTGKIGCAPVAGGKCAEQVALGY